MSKLSTSLLVGTLLCSASSAFAAVIETYADGLYQYDNGTVTFATTFNGLSMAKHIRRNHTPVFKAKVAITDLLRI